MTRSLRGRLLVVDDDLAALKPLARVMELESFAVVTASSAEEALQHADDNIDLVVSDLRMGESDGVGLLRAWKGANPNVPFILMTGDGDIASAVEAMKLGAADYLLKPVNPDELLLLIQRSLEARQKDARLKELSERLDKQLGLERLVGQCQAMNDVFARIRRAARADSTILIFGESGTGKELVAEALHQNSPRKAGPFVAVNMAAIPATLVESELFGHVKGAFTGATANRVGRFRAADGGTLFIDEIGDFAHDSQAKLLRVLESRTITPVGSNAEEPVSVRVVAATSRDLERLVAAGKFRDDLYYRLSVVTIPLPPLRERPEDIPLLIRHFLDELCAGAQRPVPGVDAELTRYLETFDWPGNVRQLRNCIESMVVMAEGTSLTLADLPATVLRRARVEAVARAPAGATIAVLERSAVEQALESFGGNRTRAAKSLGISVRTLQRKLNAWNMGRSSTRQPPAHSPSLVSASGESSAVNGDLT